MYKKSIARYLVVLLFAVFTVAAVVVADTGSLAQNTNSSTTADESVQNENTTPTRRGRRGRRGRRRAAAAPAADATADAGAAQDTGAGNLGGEQADLSGTYTGRLTMTGGHEMSGEATLTITGNTFTLTSEGMSHSGRVYAITTRGYTGASFYFADLTNSATNTPVVASVRARKVGERLTLTPVPGANTRMTFGTAPAARRPRARRGRRPATMETPATTPETEPATPPTL